MRTVKEKRAENRERAPQERETIWKWKTVCGHHLWNEKIVGGKPCADTMAMQIGNGSASAGSQIGSQESGMQVCVTGHARAYQALEIAEAGTPKRVKREGSVTPPEERAKFYVGVVDVNR